jgi:hypothetical protein
MARDTQQAMSRDDLVAPRQVSAVWTFRDGRVVEVRWEDDRDTALRAAGLA